MVLREEILTGIEQKFSEDIIDLFDKSQKRVYLEVKPESLKRICEYMFKGLGARFNTASGVDVREHMEILYHFTIEDADLTLSVRVKLEKTNLEIDSLTCVFEGADWIEREMHELLGINFRGHPDLRRLLLPEDWPEGTYPLRCDYKEWDKSAIRDRGI